MQARPYLLALLLKLLLGKAFNPLVLFPDAFITIMQYYLTLKYLSAT